MNYYYAQPASQQPAIMWPASQPASPAARDGDGVKTLAPFCARRPTACCQGALPFHRAHKQVRLSAAAVDAFAARVPGSQPGATGSGHNWLRWSPAACNNADAVGGGCWTLRCLDSSRPASRCGGPAYFRVPAFDAVGGCYAHWPRYFARRKHVKQLRTGDGPCHGAAASARCRAGGRRR